MAKKVEVDSILETPISRRKFLVGTAAGGLALALGSDRVFARDMDKELKVGFVSPRSGKLAGFGQGDPYVLSLARKALAGGLSVGGSHYKVTILDRDSQSDPSRAAQLARDLINKHNIDLMLSTSTPEVVNPVSDACEAAGVPSIGTIVPWESFYFGRGARPGQPSPFKWTYLFSFGTAQFAKAYLAMWDNIKTNKKVGVMYPNDADGNAVREHLAPILEKNGYQIVDPGPYQDGTTDYSSQIALFKQEQCEIFNTFPIPPDFATFWRQAAQQGYTRTVKIAQIAKTGLFPSQMNPLGSLAYNLASGLYWSKVFPYKSPLTGISAMALANGYEHTTGRQWQQQLGASMSLLDAGFAAVKASGDPTNKEALVKAIATLNTMTMVGKVNFNDGPVPNVSTTPIIGDQWVKAPAGSKYPLDLVTVDNADDPNVPVQRKLVPYNA